MIGKLENFLKESINEHLSDLGKKEFVGGCDIIKDNV